MTIRIPLNDLHRETLASAEALTTAFEKVRDRGWYLMGTELSAFEDTFAAYLGVSQCVGVANGTDALEIALRCLDVSANDKVIVAPNAGTYATIAVQRAGAEPIFAEIDPTSLSMSASGLDNAAAGAGAKAVIVTHLYGLMADMEGLLPVASQHGLRVVEDCAQAHGATRTGRSAGSYGDMACFSFYPTKNLGAMGDAGAIVTCDQELAERARELRQYGWRSKKYMVEAMGGRNSRMDELQAAVLLAKLPALRERNLRRKAIWKRYRDALSGRFDILGTSDSDFVAHLCVLRSRYRDSLRQRLSDLGIATDIHYPIPDHKQPIWKEAYSNVSLPLAESACNEVFSIPCFPELTDEEVEYVVRVLRDLVITGQIE